MCTEMTIMHPSIKQICFILSAPAVYWSGRVRDWCLYSSCFIICGIHQYLFQSEDESSFLKSHKSSLKYLIIKSKFWNVYNLYFPFFLNGQMLIIYIYINIYIYIYIYMASFSYIKGHNIWENIFYMYIEYTVFTIHLYCPVLSIIQLWSKYYIHFAVFTKCELLYQNKRDHNMHVVV